MSKALTLVLPVAVRKSVALSALGAHLGLRSGSSQLRLLCLRLHRCSELQPFTRCLSVGVDSGLPAAAAHAVGRLTARMRMRVRRGANTVALAPAIR